MTPNLVPGRGEADGEVCHCDQPECTQTGVTDGNYVPDCPVHQVQMRHGPRPES